MSSELLTPANITGVIIAGGQSSRFGEADKMLAKLGHQSLIEHVYERLDRQTDRVLLNVSENLILPTTLSRKTAMTQVTDKIQKSRGPLNGILAALELLLEENAESEWLLVCPCDTPFLPDDLANRLYETCLSEKSDLAIAESQGRYHPSISLWHRCLLASLKKSVYEEGKAGFKQFYPETNHCFVRWQTQAYDPFFNINYPQDLQSAQAIFDTLNLR